MRLPDGLALVDAGPALLEAVLDVTDSGAGLVELATPLLLEHPERSTTAIAPTPAAAHALRFRSLVTAPTPFFVVLGFSS